MKATRFPVDLGQRSYPIVVGARGSDLLATWMEKHLRPWCVITDTHVRRHVWPQVARAMRRRGLAVPVLDQGDLQTQIGRVEGGDIAAGPAAEDDDIGLFR